MGDFDYVEFNKSAYNEIVHGCPMYYDLSKRLKLPTTMNPYAFKGIKVDELSRKIRQNEISFDDAAQLAGDTEIYQWVCKGIAHDPFPPDVQAEYQKHIRIDEDGNLKEGKGRGYAHGFTDQFIPEWEGFTVVVDWKAVFDYKADDPCERDTYALFGYAVTGNPLIKFVRFNMRWGVAHTWVYEHGANGKLCIHPPEGEPYESPPLLELLHSRVKELRSTKCEPRPGAQCENKFGIPCDFLGNECPLSQDVAVAKQLPFEREALLAMAEGKQPITAADAPRLLSGAIQLEGFVRKLKAALKDWSKENGPIMMGQTPYGIKQTDSYSVDKALALGLMVDYGLGIEDMASVVKMEAAAIQKADFDKWPGLREEIVQQAVKFKCTRSEFKALTD